MHKPVRFRGPVFWAKTLQLVLLGAITVGMLGATRSSYDRIGHQLMCACGCGQILLECNHYGCPDSPRMINELQTQVASGIGDTGVFNWFAAKYGPSILAAPIRGGFDNVAWIMPIAVFVLATAGTFVIVWLWKRRAGSMAPAAAHTASGGLYAPEDSALRDRIRRETEY